MAHAENDKLTLLLPVGNYHESFGILRGSKIMNKLTLYLFCKEYNHGECKLVELSYQKTTCTLCVKKSTL